VEAEQKQETVPGNGTQEQPQSVPVPVPLFEALFQLVARQSAQAVDEVWPMMKQLRRVYHRGD
jgi:hypothetical protein